ncbi:MAG TPA: HD domain-containing protein [Caldithrix abyssi]|uniref:HD domain-containing protein n=1 Tax=Caldithrix abyssi TaxID=187145 RepID=A0A7V4WW76_CALAY|nr:HD domain-containing protein [Caldithrix abyssi]
MSKIFLYVRANKSRFYLYSRVIGNFILLALLLGYVDNRGTIAYKLLLPATIASIFMTLFWGTIFSNRDFEKNVAKTLIIVDWVIIFLFVYPIEYSNNLFTFLPAFVLLSTIFLLPRRELTPVLITFFLVFTVSTVVFTLLDVFERPLVTYASNGLILGLLTGVALMLLQAVEDLEARQREVLRAHDLLNKKYHKLEKELLLNKQQVDNLSRDVRKKDIEIKNILNLSGQINIRNDSKKILTSFLLTSIGQIGSTHAVILTRRKKEYNFLDIYVQKGLRGIDLSKIRIYFHSHLIQVLASVREPIFVSQIPRESLYEDEINLLSLFGKDLICPVFVQGNMAGVFLVGPKVSGSSFTKEDINLIAILANQMSFVLEQTQMTYEYQDFYAKTLRAMLQSLEAKYVYARGHNIRTANYVNVLSRKLGLSSQDVKDFSYGALLHDIGKIAIKDEYLLNPARITEQETDLKEKILQHTIQGSKILKTAGFNEKIIDMALHHHEFYNGRGFPNKIGYDDLFLGTRILSVCNAYDAMVSDRPHRKALNEKTAREYLNYYAGTQFDPELVKMFLNELDNNPDMTKVKGLN